MRALPFAVCYWSSEQPDDYPAASLAVVSSTSGWRAARGRRIAEIGLRLDASTSILSELTLLGLEKQRSAAAVDVFTSRVDTSVTRYEDVSNWRRVATVELGRATASDDVQRTHRRLHVLPRSSVRFARREANAVQWIKLLLRARSANPEVVLGIQRLELSGDGASDAPGDPTTPSSARLALPITSPRRRAAPLLAPLASPATWSDPAHVDDVMLCLGVDPSLLNERGRGKEGGRLDARVDAGTARVVHRLQRRAAEAREGGRVADATRYDDAVCSLLSVGADLAHMEQLQTLAAASEDYERAKELQLALRPLIAQRKEMSRLAGAGADAVALNALRLARRARAARLVIHKEHMKKKVTATSMLAAKLHSRAKKAQEAVRHEHVRKRIGGAAGSVNRLAQKLGGARKALREAELRRARRAIEGAGMHVALLQRRVAEARDDLRRAALKKTLEWSGAFVVLHAVRWVKRARARLHAEEMNRRVASTQRGVLALQRKAKAARKAAHAAQMLAQVSGTGRTVAALGKRLKQAQGTVHRAAMRRRAAATGALATKLARRAAAAREELRRAMLVRRLERAFAFAWRFSRWTQRARRRLAGVAAADRATRSGLAVLALHRRTAVVRQKMRSDAALKQISGTAASVRMLHAKLAAAQDALHRAEMGRKAAATGAVAIAVERRAARARRALCLAKLARQLARASATVWRLARWVQRARDRLNKGAALDRATRFSGSVLRLHKRAAVAKEAQRAAMERRRAELLRRLEWSLTFVARVVVWRGRARESIRAQHAADRASRVGTSALALHRGAAAAKTALRKKVLARRIVGTSGHVAQLHFKLRGARATLRSEELRAGVESALSTGVQVSTAMSLLRRKVELTRVDLKRARDLHAVSLSASLVWRLVRWLRRARGALRSRRKFGGAVGLASALMGRSGRARSVIVAAREEREAAEAAEIAEAERKAAALGAFSHASTSVTSLAVRANRAKSAAAAAEAAAEEAAAAATAKAYAKAAAARSRVSSAAALVSNASAALKKAQSELSRQQRALKARRQLESSAMSLTMLSKRKTEAVAALDAAETARKEAEEAEAVRQAAAARQAAAGERVGRTSAQVLHLAMRAARAKSSVEAAEKQRVAAEEARQLAENSRRRVERTGASVVGLQRRLRAARAELEAQQAAEAEALQRAEDLAMLQEMGNITVKKKEGPVMLWDKFEARRKIRAIVRDYEVDTAIKWAEYDADDYEEDGDIADWKI